MWRCGNFFSRFYKIIILIFYCKRKQAKTPVFYALCSLFSAWTFHKLLKLLETPLPHYTYNKIKLHISNFLQRHFFLLCQEGVGRRGVNQINVCQASRMLVIVAQDSNLCDHMRDRDSQSATLPHYRRKTLAKIQTFYLFLKIQIQVPLGFPWWKSVAREEGRAKLT